MRIISGKFKGRRFSPPKNLHVRPTTDIARESLFNILDNRVDFEAIHVLDMFAGTGSIGLEFASRGCRHVVALEINSVNYSFVKKTIKEIGVEDVMTIIRCDSFQFAAKTKAKFDIVFADPPYDHKELKSIPDLIFSNQILNPEGLLILEHPKNLDFTDHPQFLEKRKYGHVNFSFFQRKENSDK